MDRIDYGRAARTTARITTRTAACMIAVTGILAYGAHAQVLKLGPATPTAEAVHASLIPAKFTAVAERTNPFTHFDSAAIQPAVALEAPNASLESPNASLEAPNASLESPDASLSSSLPDAPTPVAQHINAQHIQQPMQAVMPPQDPPAGHQPPVAPLHWKYIPAGYAYRSLTAKDKALLGFRDLYSAGNFAAIIVSAGYEQATNGAPNYGTNGTAFGKRLGAAAIGETAQGVFTDVVFSPLFHQDPRYFDEGPNHPFFNRIFHAASRVLVTRTDVGHHAPNYSIFAGYAASTAVQMSYYPPINRNAKDAVSEYGSSLGAAALGFAIDEFADGVLQKLHLEKRP